MDWSPSTLARLGTIFLWSSLGLAAHRALSEAILKGCPQNYDVHDCTAYVSMHVWYVNRQVCVI